MILSQKVCKVQISLFCKKRYHGGKKMINTCKNTPNIYLIKFLYNSIVVLKKNKTLTFKTLIFSFKITIISLQIDF